MEPNTMSDRIKTYLDDPQWSEHIKDPSIQENQEANLLKYIIILGTCLVNYSH